MNTNCPNCGCTNSLDVLLAFSEASEAFAAAIKLQGKLGVPLIKYLGLFRSKNRALKFEKALKLLNEITPDIHTRQIKFDRQTYPAPEAAWVWAIGIMLERRDRGDLNTPIANHNYLYKVISSYKPEYAPAQDATPRQHATSYPVHPQYKTEAELAADLEKHEQLKRERPAMTFAEAVAIAKSGKPSTPEPSRPEARALKGIPQAQLFAHIAQNKLKGETHDQCYQRLKALETEQLEQGATP